MHLVRHLVFRHRPVELRWRANKRDCLSVRFWTRQLALVRDAHVATFRVGEGLRMDGWRGRSCASEPASRSADEPAHRRDRRADALARLTRASEVREVSRRPRATVSRSRPARFFRLFAARRWVVPRRRAARPPSRGGRPARGGPSPTRPAATAFVRVRETIGGVVARATSPRRARSRPRSRGDRPRPPRDPAPRGGPARHGKKTLNASGRATSRSRRRRPPSRPPRRPRTPPDPRPRPRHAPAPRSLPPDRRT